jgi:hypothetical protein
MTEGTGVYTYAAYNLGERQGDTTLRQRKADGAETIAVFISTPPSIVQMLHYGKAATHGETQWL